MNDSSNTALRTDGEDNATNKRKRQVGMDDVSVLGQQFEVMLSYVTDDPSLYTMPDTILLHIFGFILAIDGHIWLRTGTCLTPRIVISRHSCLCTNSLKTHLALEKTCHRLNTLLCKDSTIKLLYSNNDTLYPDNTITPEFNYQVGSLREKLFIVNGLRMMSKFQTQSGDSKEIEKGQDQLICEYMGGANGLRRIVDNILNQMELSVPEEAVVNDAVIGFNQSIGGVMIPPEFPPNGFKLFLRGDSIAYLAEVVEQHMVQRLEAAMHLAMFRSKPAASHPYPTVCPDDIVFVDAMRNDFDLNFCVGRRYQVPQGCHKCQRLSISSTPKKWIWPENDCMDDEIIGAETMQRLVRAIAFRAGILKLSGPAFECIAAEILHYLAVIVIDAFETSKSLWCQEADVGRIRSPSDMFERVIVDDIICDLSKCTLASSEDSIHSENSHDSGRSFGINHLSNVPPPGAIDEEGKHVCVIIPRQIKDAAVRLGMKPLLDDQRWEVSEGRTKKEEVKEALLMYGLSLDDENSMSEVDSDGSVWQPDGEDDQDESFESD